MSQISTASQLLNSFGVNVHVEYTDGKYASASNVIADLSYLGVTHVRDAVLNPSNQGQYNYDALAAAGIKFDFFYQGVNLPSTMGLVDAFVARHPGAVSLIEGPNEVNNFPISYNGQTGNAAAVSYQAALYTAVHADNSLAGVLVANLTSWPDLVGPSDLANYHPYPRGGVSPGSVLLTAGQAEIAAQGGRPLVMTEGGYNTLVSPSNQDGVDELTQAKYTLDILLDNAKNGVTSSYLYELLDAYSDPTNTDPEKHYGLFHLDNTPKLAATAIHNLTSILSAGADGSTAASALGFETSGLASTASTLSLTKAAGVHDIVVWNEPTIWNAATGRAVVPSGAPVTIHLDAAADVKVYDPLNSATPVQTYHNVQNVSLSLVDRPLIVEVTDLAPDGAYVSHTVAPTGSAYASFDQAFTAAGVLIGKTLYDAVGKVLETFTYNSDGSYTAHLPANATNTSTDYVYDLSGRLVRETDVLLNGQVVSASYTYSADGSVTQHYLDNSSTYSAIDYVHNSAGKLTSATVYGIDGKVQASYAYNADGTYTAFNYNADGSYSTHSLANANYESTDYLFDTQGRLIKETDRQFNGQTLTASYMYNSDGSVTQHYVDGSPDYSAIDYIHDSSGKLVRATTYGVNDKIQNVYIYNADGTYKSYDYNSDGSYTTHAPATANNSAADYVYDAAGNLINETDRLLNGQTVTATYAYAANGTVTQHYAASGSAYSAIDYVHNAAGALLSATVYGTDGKAQSVYYYNPDGGYSEHVPATVGASSVDYAFGADGTLKSQISVGLDGITMDQVFGNGLSATNNVEDEVFKLLGSSQSVSLGAGFGHASIYGFTPGQDALTLSPTFALELPSALTHAMDDGHGDTLISLDANNSILLLGVASSSVHAHLSDFHLGA